MPKTKKKNTEEGIFVNAAKAIGPAAGTMASFAGATPDKPSSAKTVKKAKLPKKNKARLPRRQKKAQKKAAARR